MNSTGRNITAQDLATLIGGELHGDPSETVHCVETVEKAEPGMLTWVGDPRFASALATSRATVVVMPLQGDAPEHMTTIRVEDPDLALTKLLPLFAGPRDLLEPGVHPSAVVADSASVDGALVGPNTFVGADAVIGPGTALYPGVFVGSGSVVGRDCVLWPNVVLREGVQVGDRVAIHANSTIGADGFSYIQREGRHIRVPQVGTVRIEDDVEIGANTTIDRARSGTTIVRRGTKIDNLVMVAHNCDIGEGSLLAAMTGIAGSTTLGKYVVCGGQAGIIDHLTIGDGVQIGAGATALNDLPPGSRVRGTPAIPVTRFGREQIALKRLPGLLKTVSELEERVEELREAAGLGRDEE